MADAFSTSKGNANTIFRLLQSPLSLRDLASMRIALYIWLEKYHKYGIIGANQGLNTSHLEHKLEPDILADVPQTIIKTIDSCCNHINAQLERWCKKSWYKNLRGVLPDNRYDHICSRLDLVVFGGNGTVHFAATIENFFDDDSLNNIRKFEMACRYCVEEKIAFLWPLVSDKLNLDCIDLQFNDSFTLYYWVCRKTDSVNKIKLTGYSRIELLMIKKCCEHRLNSAVEYFVKLWNPDDRLAEIDELFNSERGKFCVSYSLPYLNDISQRYVLDKYGIVILKKYFKGHDTDKHSVQTWLLIRDSFTPERFYNEVILSFLRMIKRRGEKNETCCNGSMDSVLVEIWSNSPAEWRRYVLDFYLPEVLYELQAGIALFFIREIGFLLAVLSDTDVDFRKTFWFEWPKLIEGVPVSQFEKLMKLCLVTSEAIDEFKGTLLNSDVFRNYSDTLMSTGFHCSLDEFLTGLYSDHAQIVDIKKQVLANGTKIFSSGWNLLKYHASYIDRVFSDNALAEDFKHGLISSGDVWRLLRDQIDRNDFNEVESIVGLFASPSKWAELVEKLLQYFRDRITNGRLKPFNRFRWEEFVSWCSQRSFYDERQNFMNSLSIDNVFEAAFANHVNGRLSANTLQAFLLWYFNSKLRCEKFKREKVAYYENMRNASVKRIFGKDKKSVIDLMRARLK